MSREDIAASVIPPFYPPLQFAVMHKQLAEYPDVLVLSHAVERACGMGISSLKFVKEDLMKYANLEGIKFITFPYSGMEQHSTSIVLDLEKKEVIYSDSQKFPFSLETTYEIGERNRMQEMALEESFSDFKFKDAPCLKQEDRVACCYCSTVNNILHVMQARGCAESEILEKFNKIFEGHLTFSSVAQITDSEVATSQKLFNALYNAETETHLLPCGVERNSQMKEYIEEITADENERRVLGIFTDIRLPIARWPVEFLKKLEKVVATERPSESASRITFVEVKKKDGCCVIS